MVSSPATPTLVASLANPRYPARLARSIQPGYPPVSSPANARYPAWLTLVFSPASPTPVSNLAYPDGIQPGYPHSVTQPG